MADAVENPANEPGADSAERAYAAAAEEAVAKADAAAPPTAEATPEVKDAQETLEFPSKPKRARAPQAAKPAAAPAVEVAPIIEAAPVVETAPAIAAEPVAKASVVNSPVTKKSAPMKKAVAAKKPVSAKMVKPAAKKPVAKKPVAIAVKASKPAKPVFKPSIKFNPVLAIKETIMATKKTSDFATTIKTAAADVQAKAKLALAKGSAVIAEASDFTKGNVDAVVASGKIFATGVQDLSKSYVAEGKSAYETLTADVKELSAVKSPADFIRVQTAIARRNLDHAFDLGAKNSEAALKLAGESFAPISARFSLAIDKFKKAA